MIGRLVAGTLAAAGIALAPLDVGHVHAAGAGTIDDLRWQHRLVLLFAPAGATAEQATSALLRDRQGLAERDLVIVDIRGETLDTLFGTFPSGETAAGLRARFGIEPSSTIALLIGKDGGVKWRTAEPIDPSELFGRIDAMPMRRGSGPG